MRAIFQLPVVLIAMFVCGVVAEEESDRDKMIQSIFLDADADKDGKLTKAELLQFVENDQPEATDEESMNMRTIAKRHIDDHFDAMDRNNDGEMNMEEYTELYADFEKQMGRDLSADL
eukprot:TRINITY_DN3003_c0_g1_i2.p1 TRINITY_DN3003_c0_g1~~TRINITY_DN3003_c0_g1_i2.p1  ORF type:complete len:118 (+),score=30.10 TRINITY_DN3003_c0_g1_i2:88-441(+)